MSDDPVIREIREYRNALADRFRDNPADFYQWLKEREDQSRRQGRKFVHRAPRRRQPASMMSAD